MGSSRPSPLPTYPDGLTPELMARLEAATGCRLCGGEVLDGLAAIERHGEHHLRTGELIAYTSVDSVVQFAAHRDVVDQERPRGGVRRSPHRAARARTPSAG